MSGSAVHGVNNKTITNETARVILVALLCALLLGLAACGGGSSKKEPPAPVVAVSVSPASATVTAGLTQSFSATVTNTSNTAVTWSVQEGSTGGSITSAGVYTAPAAPGTYHAVAPSQADTTKTAKATITVTAAQPVFSSTPVTEANEGDPYTYTVQASDPVNGTVTYALTTAPAGAAISNGVITWTPTPEQSRTPNAFKVTATTSHGGTATQTWTVSPSGTVHVKTIATFHTESGPVDVPQDSGFMFFLFAVVPDGQGGFTQFEAEEVAPGEFAIANVPAGKYWLAHDFNGIWTDSSNVDLGYDLVGRPDFMWASTGTQFTLQMTGLNPWQANDEVQPFIPNVDSVSSWYLTDPTNWLGSTGFGIGLPWANDYPLLDSASGDKTYLTQLVETPAGSNILRYAGKFSGPLAVTLTDGTETVINAPLSDVALTDTFHLNIKGSAFEQLRAAVNPNAVSNSTWVQLDVHPFGLDHGVVGNTGNLVIYNPSAPVTTDQNLGAFQYGNPYPQEYGKVLRYWHYLGVPVTAPGATNPTDFYVSFYQESTAMPSATSPIQPSISPVVSPKINGQDFFTAQTISGPATLSWQAPAIGTPAGYRVTLYEVYPEGTETVISNWSYTFYTKETSMELPTLGMSGTYIIRITADSEPNVDFAAAPYRVTAPYAHAETVSGVLTFQGPVITGKSGAGSDAFQSLISRARQQSGKKAQVGRTPERSRPTLDKAPVQSARPARLM